MVVDSQTKQLSTDEIIEIAAKNTKAKRPLEQVKHMLTVELHMPGIWKLRTGNTIYIVHRSKTPGHGFFRALNADAPRNFIASGRAFAAAAYKAGFDVLVTQFDDPTLLNIFRVIGRDKPEGMGYAVQKTDNGGFQVTLKLGQSRGGK